MVSVPDGISIVGVACLSVLVALILDLRNFEELFDAMMVLEGADVTVADKEGFDSWLSEEFADALFNEPTPQGILSPLGCVEFEGGDDSPEGEAI